MALQILAITEITIFLLQFPLGYTGEYRTLKYSSVYLKQTNSAITVNSPGLLLFKRGSLMASRRLALMFADTCKSDLHSNVWIPVHCEADRKRLEPRALLIDNSAF